LNLCFTYKFAIIFRNEGNPHYLALKQLEFGGVASRKSALKMRNLLSTLGEEFDESESRDVLAKRCKDSYLKNMRHKEIFSGKI